MRSGRQASHDFSIARFVGLPNRSLVPLADAGAPKRGFFGRLWREHEEGILYVAAAAIYIPAGVFLKTVVLNWMVGILFPLLVVCLVPKWIRRRRSKRPGTDAGVGS